ncbi:MAG TPA: glycosyltransferase family 2 protein [Longimicrobiales bacterium]|nr:glycosyltransferase family 2 protein [Longimicrobiales bacterium]
MTTPLLLSLPWLLFGVGVLVYIRWPRELPAEVAGGEGAPLVSVIVPARNEEVNLGTCLHSLSASTYPAFEIVVVDDRSEDETEGIARGAPPGNARRLEVIQGRDLPPGWLGKPWACQQGALVARGELLLFTDADTRHDPRLLGRAVAALTEDDAGLLTVAARQLLGSFWEKVIQPQVFCLLALRFPRLLDPVEPPRWRNAIANGQFVLLRREAYERVGGHEAVRGEVVEDLRLAQLVCRAGARVSVRDGEDVLATRMYRSLGGLLEGWTKNLSTGLRQARGPFPSWLVVPLTLASLVVLWLVPPGALGAWSLGVVGPGWGLWASLAAAGSVLFWGLAARRMGISPAWGLAYPLGAAMLALIILRSWLRGDRIEWKGRVYGSGASRLTVEGEGAPGRT